MELAEAHISYPGHKSNSLAGLSLILLAHRTFYISLIKLNSHLTIEKDFFKSIKLENGQIRKGKEMCQILPVLLSEQDSFMNNNSLHKSCHTEIFPVPQSQTRYESKGEVPIVDFPFHIKL